MSNRSNQDEVVEEERTYHKINSDEIEEEDTSSESAIESPFDPKKIDITSKTMVLELVLKRLRHNEIKLDTEFQREADLWDATKQSRLIESILIRLPLPAFYFDGTDDNNWLVVDGLQRISSFNNFAITKTLRLQNLEYLTQFNGYSFDELPRDLIRRIEEHEVTVYIINPGTPEQVKYNLFRRINTGGLVLTPQEIRHAINPGVPASTIKTLSELKEFKYFEIKPRRMQDRDFINRFIAFYLNKPEDYKPDLDSFLNDGMAKLNSLNKDALKKLHLDFVKSMKAAKSIFDNDAFRKRYSINDARFPINKALFEVWSVELALLTNSQVTILINKKKILKNKMIAALTKDYDFEASITASTGDKKRILNRFKTIRKIIQEVLNDR